MGKESGSTTTFQIAILGQGVGQKVDLGSQNRPKSTLDPKNIEKTMMQNKAFSSHLDAV